jgi:amino-acid N-acetyltransferase
MIRKATVKDVAQIHKLLGHFANQGLLLARPLSELYDHVRDFFVMEQNGAGPAILGVCALGICWEDLAEIKSLAVWEEVRHQKRGSQLVETCLAEARVLGLKRIFVLTYAQLFFQKLGFQEVEKNILPHKIWTDCIKCPKFPDCDETAMVLDL